MDGEGGNAVGRPSPEGETFDLPSVLAQLDTQESAEQRAAVETIRGALSDSPDACLPTVPKLRSLLEQPELEYHETVAACLADLASESPADVAPSTDEIVAVAADRPDRPATRELLRCLANVAADRPAVVAEHAETIAEVLEQRQGVTPEGLDLVQQLSIDHPAAVEPAFHVLTDALATDPEAFGARALSPLGRLAHSETPLPTLEFLEDAMAVVDHDDDSLRNNAIGCLADIAQHRPAAVEQATADITAALEHDDPKTRANATVVVARLAEHTGRIAEPARESVLESLADEHDRVRANACVAIGHAGIETATARLETLAREDPDRSVRERADWALNRIS